MGLEFKHTLMGLITVDSSKTIKEMAMENTEMPKQKTCIMETTVKVKGMGKVNS